MCTHMYVMYECRVIRVVCFFVVERGALMVHTCRVLSFAYVVCIERRIKNGEFVFLFFKKKYIIKEKKSTVMKKEYSVLCTGIFWSWYGHFSS